MATNIEVDLLLKRAVRMLHSTSTNSATELRQMLDEVIKQRYGAEKMLCKTLTKQQLEEEKNFPGRVTTPPPQLVAPEEVINLSSPTKVGESPDTIVDSEDETTTSSAMISTTVPPILTAADEDVNLKEFGDLNCCVCGEMMFTATNRLIECSKCGSLYHQECHKPAISDADASEVREPLWQCDVCEKSSKTKSPVVSTTDVVVIPEEPIAAVSTTSKTNKSATSSSSSNSSSPYYKSEQATTSKQKSNREEQRSSSSKSSTSNNSSSNVVTPSINIISASERGSKSSHSQSSSTKSSRSRHESGGKRKSNK